MEAELGKLGFEAGGADEAFEGMDGDGPTSMSGKPLLLVPLPVPLVVIR